jgi:hypothetical protein
MNAREFLDQFGREEAERVAVRAGTNLAYFEQLACCARRPSIDLADRLAGASDGRLDTLALLRAKAERAAREEAA